MDHVLPAFMRVQRSLDDATSLTASFPTLETKALTDPSSLSDTESRQILDFPDAATQQQNITASSMLLKQDLLKRAAESPNQLTDAEIKLLRNRYWANVKFCEEAALPSAYLALEGRWKEVEERLKRARADLYEENEEAAIANADEEEFRRVQESENLFQKQDLEKSFQLARPWFRQLWEEDLDRDRGRPPWGYAVYESPDMAPDEDVKGEFRGWLENVLFHAAGALCCGSTIGARWRLQRLDWPVVSTSDDWMKNNGLEERVGALREDFCKRRAEPPKKHAYDPNRPDTNGLFDGMLRNVFLYIDSDSVDSVLEGPRWVDDMWVWAVDPDYVPNEGSEYRGYLRVRVQQLMNNFYEARRFHAGEDDYSMEAIWKVAKKNSRIGAFVSLKEDEAGLFKGSRDVGSAIRPAK